MDASRVFFCFFSPNEQRGGGGRAGGGGGWGGERGGGGGAAAAGLFFFSFFFPCSANHERDWPRCKVVFFGLATHALNVRNNNDNNNNSLGIFIFYSCSYFLVRKTPFTGIEHMSQRVRRLRGYL